MINISTHKALIAIFTFLSVISSNISFAQKDDKSESYVVVSGITEQEDQDPMRDVVVELYEKGSKINSVTTLGDGVFSFKLAINSEYTIKLTKAGLVSKNFYINTKIPEYEKGTWEVAFPISLYPPCPGVDFSVLDNPVVKLVYNDVRRDFLPDKIYDKTMVAKLEQLKKTNDDCVEEQYKSIVRKADRLFGEKKYEESLEVYQTAFKIRPDDRYVEDRIDEIKELLSKHKDTEKEYRDAITKADFEFKGKNYPLAREWYTRALKVRPGSEYPTNQIAEIDRLLAEKAKQEKQQKENEEKYKKLIDQAQSAYDAGNYDQAKQAYQQALSVVPGDITATQAMAAVEKEQQQKSAKTADEKQKQEKYSSIIAKADEQFKATKYMDARQTYQSALTIIPDAKYPQSQITEIDKILARQAKDTDASFKLAIEAGDDAFNSKKYTEAKQNYQNALTFKPKDVYATSQITAIDKLIADQQKLSTQQKATRDAYNKAVAEADGFMKTPDYAKARASYSKALQIIPEEEYPQTQIAEIDRIQNKQAKDIESSYKQAIAAGDDAFDSKKYTEAKQSYKSALTYKPADIYATSQIAAIDKLVADQQKLDAQQKATRDAYNKAIAEADGFMKTPDYAKARASYSKASQILPDEKYPIQKIGEIDDILKANEKEREQQFAAFIKAGDKAFGTKTYDIAKDNYQKALNIKPADEYAKNQVQAIDKIFTDRQKKEADQKALRDKYNLAIADADKLFKQPDYNGARKAYQNASIIIPDENYPKQKITEIDNILKAQQDELERKYTSFIQAGDKSFTADNLADAKRNYQEALKVKTADTYATDRINEINKLQSERDKVLADKKAKDDAYNAAITKGNDSFTKKSYDMASSSYKQALTIKPEESYPQQKLQEIEQIKKQIEIDANYNKSITDADDYFKQNLNEQSKASYEKALTFKPNDKYATDQLAKVNKAIDDQLKKLSDQKAKQDAYDKAIADADKFYTAKDYENAKSYYQSASTILPDKTYPKQKINEINTILAERDKDAKYRATVDEATGLFDAKNYDQAKTKYKQALTIKPNEAFPAEKIKEIDNILAKMEAEKQQKLLTEKNYNESVTKANGLFDGGKYDEAKKEYERALTIMPDQAFPKQRIAKINEIKSMLAKEAKKPTTETKPAVKKEGLIQDLSFKDETERQKYLKELLAKYPEGITCEVYKEKNRTITRYIIIRNNEANDFREIKHSWGGVDFKKNDKPITQLYYADQVKRREGEYFTQSEFE
jgi:hypothetical protein